MDGQTGLLAHTPQELAEKIATLVREPELREPLGRQAYERAQEFTWDRTAEAQPARARGRARPRARADALADPQLRHLGHRPRRGPGRRRDRRNVLALIFTVVFARILGGVDYGSLAALVSALIILMVPGSALQIAVARETVAAPWPRATPTRARRCRAGYARWPSPRSSWPLLAIPARSLIGSGDQRG